MRPDVICFERPMRKLTRASSSRSGLTRMWRRWLLCVASLEKIAASFVLAVSASNGFSR